jgi:hypothetical protein
MALACLSNEIAENTGVAFAMRDLGDMVVEVISGRVANASPVEEMDDSQTQSLWEKRGKTTSSEHIAALDDFLKSDLPCINQETAAEFMTLLHHCRDTAKYARGIVAQHADRKNLIGIVLSCIFTNDCAREINQLPGTTPFLNRRPYQDFAAELVLECTRVLGARIPLRLNHTREGVRHVVRIFFTSANVRMFRSAQRKTNREANRKAALNGDVAPIPNSQIKTAASKNASMRRQNCKPYIPNTPDDQISDEEEEEAELTNQENEKSEDSAKRNLLLLAGSPHAKRRKVLFGAKGCHVSNRLSCFKQYLGLA